MMGYKLPAAGQTLVKDKVYEEKTGDPVANYMTVAKDVSLSKARRDVLKCVNV